MTEGRFSHRVATMDDLDEITRLMDLSIRKLVGAYLDEAGVEASFEIMGVDTQLIKDRTYFVVEFEKTIVGCGGWGRRATLFGGDHSDGRDARLLDPVTEPARIRAMYTHPQFARQGIGTLILELCEAAATEAGFSSVELGGTIAGEPLYAKRGYSVVERLKVTSSKGVTVPCARMTKSIARAS